MKLKIRIVLGIMISMLMQISVFANSMPMIMEEDPAFSIAPMGSTPIEVTSEYLEFDMRKGQGSTAKVTASYEMKNTSQEVIEQSMLFPFITANRKGFLSKVEITADNQPVTFKTFRLEDLPNMNYGGSTQDYFDGELSPIVTIDNIVEMLNDREYTPKHYHLDEIINVYNLHWSPKEEDYRGEVAYKIDPQKHRLLFYNYNAFSFNQDGAGTLGTWVPSKEIRGEGHKTYMVILGEAIENQGIFEISGEPEFIVEEKTFGEFLREDLIQSRLKEDPLGDQEELYNYSIKQLDRTLGGSQLLIPLDEDILAPFFYDTYIGALLYQVEFPPEGKINVTVVYEMEATRDRRETRDFTDTFLYLLRPAAGWKDFGNLTIKVIPNESKPFVIESSLPLIKDEITGIYYGEFEGLPETDLYFTTYKTDKPDPPLPKVIRNGGYLLFFLAPMLVIIMILGGIAAILLALKKKRNY